MLLCTKSEISKLSMKNGINEAKIKGLVEDLESPDRRLITRAKNTGSLMTVWGTTVTGTVLSAT